MCEYRLLYKKIFNFLCCVTLLLLTSSCNKPYDKRISEIPEDLNVLLIIVDTLPERALSAYGAPVKTPNIDKFAAGGARFAHTYAAAPWTKPSIATILSGVMPRTHGVKRMNSKFPDSIPMVAEIMKASGRQTAAVISHTILTPKHGFSRGFDAFKNVNTSPDPHQAIVGTEVTDTAIGWLKKRNSSQNFFLFLHYFDPHYNYIHHAQFDQTSWYREKLTSGMDVRELRSYANELNPNDIKYVRGLFTEEVLFTDKELGRLFEYLEQAGLSKNTLIVFVADHGEELMERGWFGHTRTLYNELINIPLIISLPDIIKPQVINNPVSQVDIFPTLLDFIRKKATSEIEGLSLIPLLFGNAQKRPDQNIFSEVDFVSSTHNKDANITAVIKGRYKLIHDKMKETFELFDISVDPLEKKDISKQNPEQLKNMLDLILQYERTTPQTLQKNVIITPEEVKQLQSLGYM